MFARQREVPSASTPSCSWTSIVSKCSTTYESNGSDLVLSRSAIASPHVSGIQNTISRPQELAFEDRGTLQEGGDEFTILLKE